MSSQSQGCAIVLEIVALKKLRRSSSIVEIIEEKCLEDKMQF